MNLAKIIIMTAGTVALAFLPAVADRWHPAGFEREIAAECRDVCARAGLVMRSVRPMVGTQSCECGEGRGP